MLLFIVVAIGTSARCRPDAINDIFRKVDTHLHGMYYGAIKRDPCTNASNMCKLFSRDDRIKRLWALNKIRNAFSS